MKQNNLETKAAAAEWLTKIKEVAVSKEQLMEILQTNRPQTASDFAAKYNVRNYGGRNAPLYDPEDVKKALMLKATATKKRKANKMFRRITLRHTPKI